jgi:hypothetical protein
MTDPKYQHGSSADGWMEQNDTNNEVARLKEQLESTKQLALKFWKVLEENGFKLELPK